MMEIFKPLRVLSCSFLLCLGLSAAVEAESMNSDSSEGKGEQADHKERVYVIEGNVLRVEYDNLIIRWSDGHEVRLQFDENTKMIGYIGPGEHIEAKVNEQSHALSIRQLQ